jgi:hypothetical protein
LVGWVAGWASRGGILAKDLVFRYADSFGDKFVSEEIKEMRARHYEEMRVMKLGIVKNEFSKVSAALWCFWASGRAPDSLAGVQ